MASSTASLAPTDAEDASAPPMPALPLPGLLPLRCAVQHYEWGRRGADSLVAHLAGEAADSDGRPCAELWMGTHPDAPSSLAPDVSLRDWVARNPAALGRDVAARGGGDLPFLFKVLSVAKALSIQAHPDKELAAALHALRPDTYRDANHKPEIAIAVTEFHALCGFAATQELKEVLRTVPEVQELVGEEESRKLLGVKEQDGGIGVRSYLKSAFTKLMTASDKAVSEAIANLKTHLNSESKPYVTRYTPSTDEFEVDRYSLPPGKSVTMSPVPGPSIFIVMTGEGEIQAGLMTDSRKAKEGDVFFVPAHTKVKLHTSCTRSMQLYRAGVNSSFPS